MTDEQLVGPQPKHIYGKRWPGPHQRLPMLTAEETPTAVPHEVDPRPHMPPALNQGQLGSCTANATARCFRYDTIVDGQDCGELSRRWIYHFEKALEGTLGQGDTGAVGHDAFTVARHGIPDEKLYPYSEDIAKVEEHPPNVEPRAYWLKKQVKAVPQARSIIRGVLALQQTIAIGFVVYESFEDESWWRSGEMPIPQPGENVLGGHEVLLCGYLAEYPDFALLLNSWGPSFGINGYFLMPWAYVEDQSNVSDLRTIVR